MPDPIEHRSGRRVVLPSLGLCLTIGTLAGAPGAWAQQAGGAVARLGGKAIQQNAASGRNWPSYGFDYRETRFSPLKEIDAGNVGKLGLAWSYPLESRRGIEATPIVVDGVMYVTSEWSIVHAIDVRTGKPLWTFDPEVVRSDLYKGCCDGVNRGVAVYKGKVYLGAFDGRLIALDAGTGKKVWEKDTVDDRKRSITITGAPRVVKDNVIVGMSGGEFNARGYVSAYDVQTGAMKWRWYTVPGDPSKPFENEAMARAAKTWDPAGKWWEVGGGGSTWDGMAYDPELNLLYIGTDNGVPWARKVRSPAGGDNLFLASIVALEPDTGKYVWHYQVMPGDTSDYSAVQQITLADLVIDGKQRKVLLQAPKNGFVIVLDRTNGKFISARNYVDVNWATGYDKNGRPVETPLYGAGESPREIVPAPYGAHNWQAMSFNPGTGLLYIPAQNIPVGLVDNRNWQLGGPNLGEPNSNTGWNIATLPAEPKTRPFGRLVAWDPVKQKEVWRHEHVSPWNGGALTTAGNLVFQGTADARVLAFDARTGKQLWESPVGSGAMAPPVTYEVDGKQYVSIAVGWGGGYGLVNRHADRMSPGAVYTFALGGNAKPPEFVNVQQGALVSGVKYDPKDVEAGAALYISNCVMCHGFPGVDRGGGAPNMGYLDAAYIENLGAFLFKGPAMSRGMPDFTDRLKPEEVEKIKAFIQGTADSIRAASVKQ